MGMLGVEVANDESSEVRLLEVPAPVKPARPGMLDDRLE
jgi:hypothetical protein